MLGPAERENEDGPTNTLWERAAAKSEQLLIERDVCTAAQHIAGADLYIGNDGGMTHVAASLRTPTVAIFGPTDPFVWRPLGHHVSAVAPPTPESPVSDVSLGAVREVVMGILFKT